jgi:hypothetical protein
MCCIKNYLQKQYEYNKTNQKKEKEKNRPEITRLCISFTDLDRCQADYFESLLTSLEASFIFYGSWSSTKNWLELIINPLTAY